MAWGWTGIIRRQLFTSFYCFEYVLRYSSVERKSFIFSWCLHWDSFSVQLSRFVATHYGSLRKCSWKTQLAESWMFTNTNTMSLKFIKIPLGNEAVSSDFAWSVFTECSTKWRLTFRFNFAGSEKGRLFEGMMIGRNKVRRKIHTFSLH